MKNFKKQKSFILWSEPMVKWFLAKSKFCKLSPPPTTIVVLVRFKLINLKKKQNVYFGTYTRNGQFRKIIKENVW